MSARSRPFTNPRRTQFLLCVIVPYLDSGKPIPESVLNETVAQMKKFRRCEEAA